MADENPVYFKLEYDESLESKKDILYSDMSLLNLLKIIKRYEAIRLEELRIKSQVYKYAKELELAVKKMKSSLPLLKIPEKEKREELKKGADITRKREDFDDDLKSQLQEIQKRLNSLSQ
jgi:hypothetical protein